jgi:shikimate 5-dehydrogenase
MDSDDTVFLKNSTEYLNRRGDVAKGAIDVLGAGGASRAVGRAAAVEDGLLRRALFVAR